MAKPTAKAAVVVLLLSGVLAAAGEAAQPGDVATVVVHVRDYQAIPAGEFADAQKLIARAYAQIGVRIDWADANARLAAADGRLHVDLIVLNAEMTERQDAEPRTFGRASHLTRRAYVYYERISAHALVTGSLPARVLALVVAHELGHVLLPDYSHTSAGLMRAGWQGRVQRLPPFLPAQGATIRELLAASH